MKTLHIKKFRQNGKTYEYFNLDIPFSCRFRKDHIETLEKMADVCSMKLFEYIRLILIDHVKHFKKDLLQEE